jgi:hypothetical protein
MLEHFYLVDGAHLGFLLCRLVFGPIFRRQDYPLDPQVGKLCIPPTYNLFDPV